MTTQIKYRRGTTAEHATFTGAAAEITVNTDSNSLIVHDGVTAGGFETASIVGLATKADQSALDATDTAVTANTSAVLANATSLGLKANVTDLYTKISEPGSEGTAGQILRTDGVGGRTWVTPSVPTGIATNAAAIADNAAAIAAIDVSSYVAQTDIDTLEAIVVEGLGAFATDIATNTTDIATNTAAIEGISGSSGGSVNHEDNLAVGADDFGSVEDTPAVDLGGLTIPIAAFVGEVETVLSINCAIGYRGFDLGSTA